MWNVALSTMWGIKRFERLGDFFTAGREAGFTRFELNHGVNSAMLDGVHLNGFRITSVHEPCPADVSVAELKKRDWLISATDEENRKRGVEAVRRSRWPPEPGGWSRTCLAASDVICNVAHAALTRDWLGWRYIRC